MLKSFLHQFLRFRPGDQPDLRSTAHQSGGASLKPRHHAAPVYPPVDQGIALISAVELIESQRALVTRLRLATGTNDATFDTLYMRVIERLAQTVGPLPATEYETHNGAGGLFRLAMELGFYALQSSESTIFAARAGVERRRLLEPRWRYATWLAAICSELYRPVTTMVVTTDSGVQWPAYQHPLDQWLRSVGADRCYVKWIESKPGKHRSGRGASAVIAQRVIHDDALQYLHEASNEIAPVMLDVITGAGQAQERHPMTQIINDVRDRVMKRDHAVRPANYGRLTVGQHVEPHLLDAMRRLFAREQWTINVKKSRLWLGDEGLFLVWPTAAKEMLAELAGSGVAGIPQEPQTLLDILIQADVFEEHLEGGPFWAIMPPLSATELTAVKFANPDVLLGTQYDAPKSAGVLTKSNKADAQGANANTTATAQSDAPAAAHAPASDAPAPAEQSPSPLAEKRTASPSSTVGEDASNVKPPTGPTPAAAKPRPERTSTEAKEKDVGATVRQSIGKGLDPLTQDVFGALIDDLRSGKILNQAGKCREGFAIGLEQLAAYGVDVTTFAAAVQKAGWLYVSEDKPNKKIHEVQINGKLQRAVVVRTPIAVDLGLIL